MRSAPAWPTRVLGLCLATGIVATSVATPASARMVEPSEADIERARELYENGVSLFDEGSYEGAALAFERAYELSEDNNLLYNIALAYDRNDDFEKAIEYLDRYRALAPKSERASLERRKKSLVRRLEKQREIEANGGETEPDVEDDPIEDESIEDELIEDELDGDDERPPRKFPPLAWALTATAAVGFGLGTGFGVASLRSSKTGREGCTELGDELLCQSDSGEDLRRGRTHAIIADVSLGVGIAATIGAIVVVALAAKKRKASETALAPMLGPRHAGLSLQHRF